MSGCPDTQPPPWWRLLIKWLTCSGSQPSIFQWKLAPDLLFISKTHLHYYVFHAAMCLVLTTWERGTRYYHHNHRLPPACLTWTHYSCHPSPRRSLSPTPRVHISAFGRWINQMLNFKVTTSKCLGEHTRGKGISFGFLRKYAYFSKVEDAWGWVSALSKAVRSSLPVT